MNPEFKELADDIYRRRVLRARALTPEQRLLHVFELQDEANAMMMGGVTLQFPNASPAEAVAILSERRRRLRVVSDHGLYRATAAA